MDPTTPRSSWPARYFDGQTPVRHEAMVTIGPRALLIALADGPQRSWDYEGIRHVQGTLASEPVRIEYGGSLPEVLILEDRSFLNALRRHAPSAPVPAATRGPRRYLPMLGWGISAVTVLVLAFGWGIPTLSRLVADHVPVPWEERLAEQARRQLASDARPAGDDAGGQALRQLLARLDQAARPHPYRFQVLIQDRDQVNAFALPAGTMVFHTALLRESDSADEVAAVMAHEMVHVLRRHSTRAVVRHAAVGLLVAGMTGGMDQGGKAFEGLVSIGMLQHDRELELEADAAGLELMQRAGLDGRAMIRFFRKLQDGPGILAYLSDHPDTEARIARLEERLGRGAAPVRPLDPPMDWELVRRSLTP